MKTYKITATTKIKMRDAIKLIKNNDTFVTYDDNVDIHPEIARHLQTQKTPQQLEEEKTQNIIDEKEHQEWLNNNDDYITFDEFGETE